MASKLAAMLSAFADEKHPLEAYNFMLHVKCAE